MKRFLIFFSGLALCAGSVSAAPVSKSEALNTAEKFISRNISPKRVNGDRLLLSEAALPSDDFPFYIFDIADDGGFIVVSADDRTRPVLAWADNASYNPEDVPAPVRYWLSLYASQINSLKHASLSSSANAPLPERSPVEPIILTQWGQNYPFNAQCPTDNFGMRCVTGCVATALAQVMRHYNHPAQPRGSVSYTESASGIERSLDFSTIGSFDWQNMTLRYDDYSTAAQIEAVATLMKAAAYSVEMQFSPNTSMAYFRNIGPALRNYFDYNPDVYIYTRNLMSDSEWEAAIYNELAAGRPVLFDGHNPQMGHTFVCDGCDANGLFHFNWGWRGLSDGYFALSALNPEEQSTGGSDAGYNDNQSIICNILLPDDISSPQSEFLLSIYSLYFGDSDGWNRASETPEFSAPLPEARLFFNCLDHGFDPFAGDVYLASVADDGSITPLVKGEMTLPINPGGYQPVTFRLADASLVDGDYTLKFVYRLNDSDSWHKVLTAADAPDGARLSLDGDNVSMKPVTRTDFDYTLSGISSPVSESPSLLPEILVAGGRLNISSLSELENLTIYDLTATLIYSTSLSGCSASVDVSSLANGLYIVSVTSANGQRSNIKLHI